MDQHFLLYYHPSRCLLKLDLHQHSQSSYFRRGLLHLNHCGCKRRSLKAGKEDLACTTKPLLLSLLLSEFECLISLSLLTLILKHSLFASTFRGLSKTSKDLEDSKLKRGKSEKFCHFLDRSCTISL